MVNNFRNKKVLIMGLGLHGGALAVATWLLRHGARLTITDIKTAKQLRPSLNKLKKLAGYKTIKFSLGGHDKEDFLNQDLVVQNPGVPRLSPFLKLARKNQIPIVNEAVMFFGLFHGPIVGVTGTRGKSTTATLIHHLLKNKIKNNVLAGNIATTPMLAALDKLAVNSWPVLELSSWHLENLDEYHKSPNIAVVTNVLVDHLNRYRNFAEYRQTKFFITKWQSRQDQVVLNYDNIHTRSFASKTKARVYYFSLYKKVRGSYCRNNEIYFYDGHEQEKIIAVSEVKIIGQHNLANVLAAVTVAKLLKVPTVSIIKVLHKFSGIPYRLQYEGQCQGKDIYNDATSTTPDAALAALQALRGRQILLLAGGQDKSLDYLGLAKQIKSQVRFVVLLKGTGSQKLLSALKKIRYPKNRISAGWPSLLSAWKIAKRQKGVDCIIFSPAAASFNMFTHEFERAKAFSRLVHDQKKK